MSRPFGSVTGLVRPTRNPGSVTTFHHGPCLIEDANLSLGSYPRTRDVVANVRYQVTQPPFFEPMSSLSEVGAALQKTSALWTPPLMSCASPVDPPEMSVTV